MIDQWRAEEAVSLLRVPAQNDHKYTRGTIAVRTGGARYPGAAVLGVSAAWRTGIGMVRYVPPIEPETAPFAGLPSPAAAVLAARPETVFGEAGRAPDAWVVGSGTDAGERGDAERAALASLFCGDAPLVVDAGAIEPFAAHTGARGTGVITPHDGEFAGVCRALGLAAPTASLESRAAAAVEAARELGSTVLLKGSVTVVATPGGWVRAVGPATPWLATAGTGDVLAGVLGALVASHASLLVQDPEFMGPVAATAALVHDAAARLTAGDHEGTGEGSPITALDIAETLPSAIEVLRG